MNYSDYKYKVMAIAKCGLDDPKIEEIIKDSYARNRGITITASKVCEYLCELWSQ